MAQTSLEVVIRGRDEFSKTAHAVTSALTGMERSVSKLSAVMQGMAIGAGIAGFNVLVQGIDRLVSVLPDAIESSIKFGNTIDDLRDATGATTRTASEFAGAMQYTTGSFEGLGPKLREVTQELFRNEAGFKALGIETRNAAGAQLDTLTIIENTRRVFATMPSGVEKAAIAIQLFGRNALSMIDYLSLSDAQVAKLNEQLQRMGYTIADTAPFEAAQRELNLWDLAWQGLSNSLTATVLPAIRQVIASITEAVVRYGPQIKAVLADIINFISGIAAGLTGISVAPFQQQMDQLATTTGGTVLSFKDWATVYGKVIPQTNAATAAVGGLSTAFDKQSEALDRNIARVKALDAASKTLYDRQMANLVKGVDAQIAAIDAGEKALDIERQRKANQQAIADAQKRLAEASRPGKGGLFDVEAIREAKRALDEARAAAQEYERALSVSGKRDQLESTKAYIQSVADIEANATNRTALATTLANRRKVLESRLAAQRAANDAEGAADTELRLAAVVAAEARNIEAKKAADKIKGYETEKAKIAEVKAAALSANRAVADDTAAKLAELQNEYDIYKTGVLAKLVEVKHGLIDVNDTARGRKGDAKGGAKAGVSPIAQAFIEGRDAAQQFLDVLGKIGDTITSLTGGLKTIQDAIGWVMGNKYWIGGGIAALGVATGSVPLVIAGLGLMGIALTEKGPGLSSKVDTTPGGLKGLQYQVPGGSAPYSLVPQTNTTVHTHIYLDGKVIAEVVDKYLGGHGK